MEGQREFEENEEGFSLGKSKSTHQQKHQQQKPQQAIDKRLQTFNQGNHEDLKRKRELYQVQLRNKKKDETFKQKRAFIDNSTTPLGVGSFNQNQLRDSDRQGIHTTTDAGNGLQQQQQQTDTLLKISIENALQASTTMPYNEFVSMAQRMEFTMNDFPKLSQLINDKNEIYQTFATIGFRRLLSFERNPPIQTVIDLNLVPKFLSFLKRFDQPKLQFEAAWCITNLASGNNDHVQVLLEKGTVDVLIELLASPQLDVIEQAIWGLGNIAGENHKIRDMVISAGAVAPIARILDQAQPGTSLVRNASWALSNFCRGRPPPQFDKIKKAIPSLAKVLIENDNQDVLIDVCWAMSYLSDGGEERIPIILGTKVLPRMIQLLAHQNIAISVPCLRTIGNVVTGDDQQTQYAIDCGALNALNCIIYHKKKTVRKEVCWTLSNITAGCEEQIQACIDLGVIEKLLYLLINDEVEIKKEAVWAISNCTASATTQQFFYLVQKGILKGLQSVLAFKEPRILAVALEGIDNVLKAGKEHFMNNGDNQFALLFEQEGGLDKLEALQLHPNHQIYDRVVKIIEAYFSEDNGQIDINKAQAEADDGSTFNF